MDRKVAIHIRYEDASFVCYFRNFEQLYERGIHVG